MQHEFVAVGETKLYTRVTGEGQPMVILHGGPDFDHRYLLPELDRLSDLFRLIYYDQRGRGKSSKGADPEDVSVESEVQDLERIRQHFGLDAFGLLGHSWGGLVAMEYAVRHPNRVSHLILMNSSPVTRADYLHLRQELRRTRSPEDLKEMEEIASTQAYKQGDLEAEAEYYRLHFRIALRDPELLEEVVQRLRFNFTPAGVIKARAIERRLMEETWLSPGYTLLPKLKRVPASTLILHGEDDFIPVQCVQSIAQAIKDSHLIVLPQCGHFAYLECPDQVLVELSKFIDSSG